MTIRSMKWAAGVSLFAAMLAVGTTLPERQASAQVQAVPRAGLAFNDTITQRVTIESVDPEGRTVAFTLPDGQLVAVPVADSVSNLAAIQDGSMANVTYNQIVTILNLRQKGPGSQGRASRVDEASPTPPISRLGRFTVTVVGVDLANNTVSVIDGRRRRRPYLQGQHARQAGNAEEDQGRRRGDRSQDAADGHGDLAGAVAVRRAARPSGAAVRRAY